MCANLLTSGLKTIQSPYVRRPEAESKPSRGIQNRPLGSGLVIRAVFLAGLPDTQKVGRPFLMVFLPHPHPIPHPRMAVTREEKAVQLADLKEKFSKASSVIFAHYIGMTVAQVSNLRKKLREGNAEMKVAKKTLMSIATKEAGL